jgi:hypothetical protein
MYSFFNKVEFSTALIYAIPYICYFTENPQKSLVAAPSAQAAHR